MVRPRMEVAHVERHDNGLTALGTQLCAIYELRYRLEPHVLSLERVGERSLDVQLGDADYLDLGWSPLFNSLPVMGDELLELGPPREYKTRRVDVPSLEISISEQLHEPLGKRSRSLHSGELHRGHPVR